MTMPRRALHDFTPSSDSDDPEVDPFAEQREKEFNIPSAVGLSDEEEPSSRQYRAERMREDAAETFEEECPSDLVDQMRRTAVIQNLHSKKLGLQRFLSVPSADAVYLKFINMSRKFVTELENLRKQDLLARKGGKAARKSLISMKCVHLA